MKIYNVKTVKDETFNNTLIVAPNERTAKKRFNTKKVEYDVIVKIEDKGSLYDSLIQHGYDDETAKAIEKA